MNIKNIKKYYQKLSINNLIYKININKKQLQNSIVAEFEKKAELKEPPIKILEVINPEYARGKSEVVKKIHKFSEDIKAEKLEYPEEEKWMSFEEQKIPRTSPLKTKFLTESLNGVEKEPLINVLFKEKLSNLAVSRNRAYSPSPNSRVMFSSMDGGIVEKNQSFSSLRLPTHKLVEDSLSNLFGLHEEKKGIFFITFSDSSTLNIDRGVLREVCAHLGMKIKIALQSSEKSRENIENFLRVNEEKIKRIIKKIARKRKEGNKLLSKDSLEVMNASELGSEGPIKKPQKIMIMPVVSHQSHHKN